MSLLVILGSDWIFRCISAASAAPALALTELTAPGSLAAGSEAAAWAAPGLTLFLSAVALLVVPRPPATAHAHKRASASSLRRMAGYFCSDGTAKRNRLSSSAGLACGSNVVVYRLLIPAGVPFGVSSKILRTSSVSASIHTVV